MNTSAGHTTIPEDYQTLQIMKAAFNAPNNRVIVFNAVRDENNKIVDFEFSLISKASFDFFNGIDYTGMRFTDVRADQNDQLQSMIEVIETGLNQKWERYTKDVNGNARWYSVSDAKVGEFLVRVWEDITDKRLAEEEINAAITKKAEEKYLSLFNSIDQGFCIIEMLFDENDHPHDYIFLEYNPAFEKQTGLKDARGKRIKDMNPHHEQHWFDLYGGIAKNMEPLYFEQEAVLINGWYEVSAFPLSKQRDNKIAVIFNDITARKKAEREREAFSHMLEEQVYKRTAELNSLNALLEEKNLELEKSNKELESFNYVASHDLQEPLRKIQTFLSIITNRDMDSATAKNYMSKISNSAARMSNLIQDVLTYSRLNAESKLTEVDLNTIITNVKTDYELTIAEKNAVINSSYLPVINANALQMHQLFSNLISNSLKYNTGQPVITITATTFKDNEGVPIVEIVLSDNGIGFDEQYKEQMFKLFHRLHGKSEFSGTGIGLSICKKIVEQHHGTITAQSVPGKGATFTIHLPL
ncbi:PAS domain S-box protein [Flavobacterium zepuense]|uniref:histidine kinase n=1 Tax=Flavobacterium zepuense TaxID=2593302 RepID=A0A552V7L8_9FLAO|nr:PAS domain-containing sensor histidine kinase [Flavobacterium zepuense]TRW26454.1 PAS domain S-box protein [Flavobacterium zepuense]